MPEIDLSLTITGIIALSAIFSPIITGIINNYHATKIKKMDMYETAKRNALSTFIDCAQAAILNSTDRKIIDQYVCSFDKLFIYFSNISVETIKPFDHARGILVDNYNDDNYIKANHELCKLISTLSEQIKKR